MPTDLGGQAGVNSNDHENVPAVGLVVDLVGQLPDPKILKPLDLSAAARDNVAVLQRSGFGFLDGQRRVYDVEELVASNRDSPPPMDTGMVSTSKTPTVLG